MPVIRLPLEAGAYPRLCLVHHHLRHHRRLIMLHILVILCMMESHLCLLDNPLALQHRVCRLATLRGQDDYRYVPIFR